MVYVSEQHINLNDIACFLKKLLLPSKTKSTIKYFEKEISYLILNGMLKEKRHLVLKYTFFSNIKNVTIKNLIVSIRTKQHHIEVQLMHRT